MKRALRFTLAILTVAIICEAYFLWYAAAPSFAQTTPFLGRPYYGPAVSHNSQFDHDLPIYSVEGSRNPNAPNKLMRSDGAVYNNAALGVCIWNIQNACYSGHDARDFALTYKPVVSAAQGIVYFAGWQSTDHTVGLGLSITVEHNSSTFRTYYGHLSAVRYQPTTSVGRWQIGTSGNTGSSSGPHLHFSVSVKRPGANWAITDPYDWTGQTTDPWSVQWDGTPSEWLWLPEPDRTIAEPPRGTEIVMDDTDTGSTQQCPTIADQWSEAYQGPAWGLTLHYVNSANSYYNCLATWGGSIHGSTVSLPSTGLYEVEVHIPAWNYSNSTHAARYTVQWPGTPPTSNVVVVDQSRISTARWISLGRYTFQSGSQTLQYVTLHNNSQIGTFYECTAQHPCRTIQVDALRLVKSH